MEPRLEANRMKKKPAKKVAFTKKTSAQKPTSVQRPAALKKSTKKAKKKVAERPKQPTIKPPRAGAMMRSPEVGAHVGQDQAIAERLRLYPKATTREIVAMFELDGVKISPAAVEQVRRRGS